MVWLRSLNIWNSLDWLRLPVASFWGKKTGLNWTWKHKHQAPSTHQQALNTHNKHPAPTTSTQQAPSSHKWATPPTTSTPTHEQAPCAHEQAPSTHNKHPVATLITQWLQTSTPAHHEHPAPTNEYPCSRTSTQNPPQAPCTHKWAPLPTSRYPAPMNECPSFTRYTWQWVRPAPPTTHSNKHPLLPCPYPFASLYPIPCPLSLLPTPFLVPTLFHVPPPSL